MSSDKPTRVLIVGATSGIARAIASRYAVRGGVQLVLAARDRQALEQDAEDLRIRHKADIEIRHFDATDESTWRPLIDGVDADIAVLCHGVLVDNDAARSDWGSHRRMIEVNYTSYAAMLEMVADKMQARGGGVIAAISSVAGDRGRKTNYCYGATKAALSAYADGLRGRLFGTGVHVVTVKPGPVATPMTEGNKARSKMADPAEVAKQIVRAIDHRKDVVYTPGKWRVIMAVVRVIPDALFKRLSI